MDHGPSDSKAIRPFRLNFKPGITCFCWDYEFLLTPADFVKCAIALRDRREQPTTFGHFHGLTRRWITRGRMALRSIYTVEQDMAPLSPDELTDLITLVRSVVAAWRRTKKDLLQKDLPR